MTPLWFWEELAQPTIHILNEYVSHVLCYGSAFMKIELVNPYEL